MDTLIAIINAGSSALIAVCLIWAVLDKRVLDGLVIKVGLCSMAMGFIVVSLHMLEIGAADVRGLQRAMLLINSGIAVVILGYVFRHRSAGHALRRVSDWVETMHQGATDGRR